ncbi:MAG TPA: hypothetical protein VKV36_01280 [Acidimicrobiales bacterium]|nr:hypothetical protein [Acidimicrobiales bacterium]
MIGVYIHPSGLTEEVYRSIDEGLRAAGVEPKGIKMHSCFGEGDGLAIFDVWESEKDWQTFAAHLEPIAAAAGVAVTSEIVPMVAFDVP